MKEELLNFISQPIPKNIGIVKQSVPIIFFGNIETAKSATISINPSDAEFMNQGHILVGNQKRFVDRDEVNISDNVYMTLEQADIVYQSCKNYFKVRPYKKWFNGLERIISELGYSYYNDSLVHLDITPWATSPTWNDLHTKQEVLEAGENIAGDVLANIKLDYLFINGNTAFQHVEDNYKSFKVAETETVSLATRDCKIYSGNIGDTKVLGWSLYAQAALKVSDREKLISELKIRL